MNSETESRSVVSDSLQLHGLYSPWNSPGQDTGVGSLPLLQGIFPTQGSNPGLPHCRWILYQLSQKGSLKRAGYIYTMEYYAAMKKNTFESVLMKWMKLEPIIQSEVSQKEKHQYSILTHIYGI